MLACLFDTETTGLIDNMTLKLERQPYVTEFYGELVDLATGDVKEEVEHLFDVPVALDEKITQITGITNEMLKGQPKFLPKVIDFVEASPVAIAHNLSFDKDMLTIEAKRLGRKFKIKRGICTVEATIGIKGYRLNLSSLHEHLFGAPFAGAHRAREDVKALTRCAVELFRRDFF
jgi:DNA polymerase III epsilon subunit-like protein